MNEKDIESLKKCKYDCQKWRIKNPDKYEWQSKTYDWKRRGLIIDNDDDLFGLFIFYQAIENCEQCGILFKSKSDKCLDHNHLTGQFRDVICRSCNFTSDRKKYYK